jgi:hypothetical protein
VQGGQIFGEFPTFEAGGSGRCGCAWAVDSDHVDQSVWRDVVFVVWNSRPMR